MVCNNRRHPLFVGAGRPGAVALRSLWGASGGLPFHFELIIGARFEMKFHIVRDHLFRHLPHFSIP